MGEQYGEILDIDGRLDVWEFGFVKLLPDVRVSEEHHALGVIDKVDDAVRKKISQNRYDYAFIGIDGEERNGPPCGIPGTDCNPVAFFDTCPLKHDMEFLNDAGDISVCEIFSFVIADDRIVPSGFH